MQKFNSTASKCWDIPFPLVLQMIQLLKNLPRQVQVDEHITLQTKQIIK